MKESYQNYGGQKTKRRGYLKAMINWVKERRGVIEKTRGDLIVKTLTRKKHGWVKSI